MLAEASPLSSFGWLLAILAILIAGLYVSRYVKKRLNEPDDLAGPGFTLSDLRQLHKNGQMSDEEFERAKAKIVVAAKTAALREPAKPAPPERRWNSGDQV